VPQLAQRVLSYIRARQLLRAGHRVGVAVSGGADSVALFRLLLELREELGIVVSVVHFHHGLRGTDADCDAAFVANLAKARDLEVHSGTGDTRAYAAAQRLSVEAGARELRLEFFQDLLRNGKLDRIATGHTLDDQAETVLMKALRGAGTRGLAGVYPEQRLMEGSIIRPLLEVRREELRAFLREVKQDWREDLSNADPAFTRNRLRARVMPALRAEVNPSAEVALAHLAEIACAEEEYWNEHIKRLLPMVLVRGEPARGGGRKQTSSQSVALDLEKLAQQPLAVRRRLLRAAADSLGCPLDFEHVSAILDLAGSRATKGRESKVVEIGQLWRARMLFRELRLEKVAQPETQSGYEYDLPLPGEIEIAELGSRIRARISEDNGTVNIPSYNRAHLIECTTVPPLRVRNWRHGDRFQPARHSTEKRLKELLNPLHLRAEEKQLWPVVVAGERIIWVRGIDGPHVRTGSGKWLWIEESTD
jgi:tRNA(Ile)-lysidine synthase